MEYNLKVDKREIGPSSKLTKIRKDIKVPGVIYGYKKQNLPIIVEYNSLLKILKEAGTSNVVNINLNDKKYKVIVREYQQDPVTDKITHVDFMIVTDKSKIITTVPLLFEGVSPAVKEKGAKLDIKNKELKIECLLKDLPSSIVVDISLLKEIRKGLVIRDLDINKNIKVLNNLNDPVVNTSVPKELKSTISTTDDSVEGEESIEGEEGEESTEGKEGEKSTEGKEGKKSTEGKV